MTQYHPGRPADASHLTRTSEPVFFVEGEGDDSFDVHVVEGVMGTPSPVTVRPLGPSYDLRDAARALRRHNPRYFFLIDRDHYDDAFVEKSWRDFEDRTKRNLLVWPRREIENYFIDPEFLSHSTYLKKSVSADQLRERIRQEFAKRLYVHAANLTIVQIREELKKEWIDVFRGTFASRDDAITALRGRPEFSEFGEKSTDLFATVESRFDGILEELSGGARELEYGRGRWLELIPGKKPWQTVANDCFSVEINGEAIQSKEKRIEIALDLLAHTSLSNWPADLRRLREVIFARIEADRS